MSDPVYNPLTDPDMVWRDDWGWLHRLQVEKVHELEAACAAMREALRWCIDYGIDRVEIDRVCGRALSADAGRDFIERDKVKPLVEALGVCAAESELLWQSEVLNGGNDGSRIARISDAAAKALALAKQLGLEAKP